MNPSIIKHLGTIEVLLQEEIICRLPYNHTSEWKPFYWKSSVKGDFNPISLLYSQGWMRNTDIEIAINNWWKIEKTGVLTPEGDNFYADCVFEYDEDEVDRESPEFQERQNIYQQLSKLLISSLYNLEVYQFSSSVEYSCFAIVGQQLDDESWICFTSKVPQETPDFSDILVNQDNTALITPLDKPKSNLEFQVDKILESLTPVITYGHYDGGYDNTYQHQIVYQTGSTKEISLQNALIKSGFIKVGNFQSFYPDEREYLFNGYYGSDEEGQELYQKYQRLNSFLKANFPELRIYTFRFRDYTKIFIVGKSVENDRVGLKLDSEFDYNP